MKRFQTIFILLSTLLLITSSCKDRKTYADYLKDESKAIDLFLKKNDLSILESFPKNGIFNQNDFYEDPETGVYYNIVDYGDTTKNLQIAEKVYARFSGVYFMVDDSVKFSNLTSTMPFEMEFYGPVNTTTKNYYTIPGLAVPLTRVGHNGVVKLIVPFNMGSANDRQQYQPTYYDYVTYRFENHIR
ncbi:MAG: DUF4827 family protein [Fermentimonas sp.]|nr:DUF4827 family protein [Fermentimonas sp.]